MCEPVTIASLSAMAVGGGLQAWRQYRQASAEQQAARANQRLANIAAGDALLRGQLAAGQARMEGSQVIGEQATVAGASGVDPSSSAGLHAASRAYAEADARTLISNAAREAWGYRVESRQYAAEAQAAGQRKWMGPFATILGTAGQLGATAYQAWGRPGYQSSPEADVASWRATYGWRGPSAVEDFRRGLASPRRGRR